MYLLCISLFPRHCFRHALYPKALEKSLVWDILSFESMFLRPLSPLGLFCGQMKDESKVNLFFFFRSCIFLDYDAIFPLKKLYFKNADTKTRYCILILIPLKLQWVKGGRNFPLMF